MALIRILRKLAPVHVTDVTLVTKILEHLKQFNPTVLKSICTVKWIESYSIQDTVFVAQTKMNFSNLFI